MPDEPKFTVTSRESGYAHVRLLGTYTGQATDDDVAERFYHPYLGGRQAWARDGKWGCVVHTD